jgi:hypothetical protein
LYDADESNSRYTSGMLLTYSINSSQRAEAESKPLLKKRIWTGGSREEYEEYLERKEYEGNSTIYIWREPLKVRGNDGASTTDYLMD